MVDQEDILKMKKLENEIGHVGDHVEQKREEDGLEKGERLNVNVIEVQINADVMDV